MGRHNENHRFLKTILVLDEHMNVIQRHEVDESGRLINDATIEARNRNLKKKPALRLARKTEPEVVPISQPTMRIQPIDEDGAYVPVFSVNQIVCRELDTDLLFYNSEESPEQNIQPLTIPIVW